jgi:hypothetical protein
MSKQWSSKGDDKGKAERQVRGGGAGRHPGDSEAVRPTPTILGMLMGTSKPADVGANMPVSRKSGTRPQGRAQGTSKDTSHPKSKWW